VLFSFPFSFFSFYYFKGYNNAKKIQRASNYPDVRVFTVARKKSDDPLYDLPGILVDWSPASESKQAVTKVLFARLQLLILCIPDGSLP